MLVLDYLKSLFYAFIARNLYYMPEFFWDVCIFLSHPPLTPLAHMMQKVLSVYHQPCPSQSYRVHLMFVYVFNTRGEVMKKIETCKT